MRTWTVYIASIKNEAFYVGATNCMPHRIHCHGTISSSPILRYIQKNALTINDVSFWAFAKFPSKRDALYLETMLIRLISYHDSLNILNTNKTFKRRHNEVAIPVVNSDIYDDDYEPSEDLERCVSNHLDSYALKEVFDLEESLIGASQKDVEYKNVLGAISRRYSIKKLEAFLKTSFHKETVKTV